MWAKHGERAPGPGLPPAAVPEKDQAGTGHRRIRCPRCAWRPSRADRWSCTACGHAWNTFDTFGRCPGCGFQYTVTQCFRCLEFSPHPAWYEQPPPQPG